MASIVQHQTNDYFHTYIDQPLKDDPLFRKQRTQETNSITPVSNVKHQFDTSLYDRTPSLIDSHSSIRSSVESTADPNKESMTNTEPSSIRQSILQLRQDSFSKLSAQTSVKRAENDPTASNSTHNPTITSPSDFRLAPASTFKKVPNQQKQRRSILARYSTSGHLIPGSVLDQEGPELTEEFEKELTQRRRTFKRLSRRKALGDEDEDKVLFGTRISEGHQNYTLMYNMLTGIRIAVGRVSAKMSRPLVDADFTAANKLAFDVIGDELTPGAKYDFKFKDYAPWVFRSLREIFGVDPADYLISLTSKYILSELGSPGKSGSFFYYSRDYRFIIKTIHHTEHKFMRTILRDYHHHVSTNHDTLLCRYYGLHRVKLPHGRKIHFVVMGNILPPNKDIHETYDLKGSTIGRLLPEEDIRKNPYAVMKDLNWEKRGKKLQLGPHKRNLFITQLLRDVRLLVRMNIMDYSLMVGVHDIIKGNKDNVRNSTLQLFQPDTKLAERRASMMKRRESKAMAYRKVIMEANPDKLNAAELPDTPSDERRNCAFYSDDGGFQATDEVNRPAPSLYYMGVIDILTPYDMKKKSEHFFKAMTQDRKEISAVKPKVYGKRFMGFMANILEHNEDVPQEFQLETREKIY